MKVQVVDENDNIIGYKERAEIDYKKDIYRISALWVTNSKGEILVAQRKLTKDKDPGMWDPAAAGTVEEYETYESNIYKEAQEEIGLTGETFLLGPKQRRFTPRQYFCQWYTVILDRDIKDFKIQEDELEQITWIPEEQLVQEVKENPEKWIPPMSEIIKTFIDNSKI